VRGDNESSQLLLVCESVLLLFLVEIGDYIESELLCFGFAGNGLLICRLQLVYEKVCNQNKKTIKNHNYIIKTKALVLSCLLS